MPACQQVNLACELYPGTIFGPVLLGTLAGCGGTLITDSIRHAQVRCPLSLAPCSSAMAPCHQRSAVASAAAQLPAATAALKHSSSDIPLAAHALHGRRTCPSVCTTYRCFAAPYSL